MQDKNKTKSALDCSPLSAAEAIVVESIENAVTKVTAIAKIRLKNDLLFGFFCISFFLPFIVYWLYALQVAYSSVSM